METTPRQDPKFSQEFDRQAIEWFDPDSLDILSPMIGFVETRDHQLLILLAGPVSGTVDEKDRVIGVEEKPAVLKYDAREWDAYIKGVKDGEFDDYYEKTEEIMAVRDTKDRQGPVLTFPMPGFAAFANAIKAGKYDLPAAFQPAAAEAEQPPQEG